MSDRQKLTTSRRRCERFITDGGPIPPRSTNMGYKDPEKQREYQRKWCAKNRAKFLEGKICTFPGCSSVINLEVDHIDRTKKDSHRIWSWSEKKREEELKKCQILCEEHHKEKTKKDLGQGQKHGTHNSYVKYRCRCVECKKAHAVMNSKYR